MSKQTNARAQAEAARAAVGAVKAHAERAGSAARAAATGGIRTVQDAVSTSGTLHDGIEHVRHTAGPVREAAKRARHTAGTLTARTGHRPGRGNASRSWRSGVLAATGCAFGAGVLLWWLACRPEADAMVVLPVQPVPPA